MTAAQISFLEVLAEYRAGFQQLSGKNVRSLGLRELPNAFMAGLTDDVNPGEWLSGMQGGFGP